MKLELKHLAAYLPYEVGMLEYRPTGEYTIFELDEETIHYVATFNNSANIILRPLSDLTKETTHKGKTFVPCLYWDDKNRIDLLSACSNDNDYVDYLEYFIVQKLLEWHFDIFGLIDAGLAVDINTIKTTQL